jgi:hypothetical protein
MKESFDLAGAALAAASRLTRSAGETAARGVLHGSFASTQRAMAATAQATIFTDALLGAIRSRLNEIRTITK